MSSPAFDDRDGSIWFDGELICHMAYIMQALYLKESVYLMGGYLNL